MSVAGPLIEKVDFTIRKGNRNNKNRLLNLSDIGYFHNLNI
ncbi:hypothetical protein NMY3_01291 [Candidatus Nitrosocosmicus oleophilus]|jgi:hypothetical protein|uniref:Uncharacterized protein n=1 Tax=Candidatus Nitrosocosmicus oleophilus TaxID=1353260 RepID=A0A654LWA8_9ARCH|nr:hypothetical protein NMY3_01291 [Candidatus Nitrosocosmicus oleophilus]